MNLEKISLSSGKHSNIDHGACVMEMVSYLANERWSDHPQCASPSITSLAIWIKDNGDQEHRDVLKTMAPKIVNTKDWKKEPARAKIYAEFAQWASDRAREWAKHTKHTEYAKFAAEDAMSSAKYSKFAAKTAEYDKSIAYAIYAVEDAVSSAKYVKAAAEYTAKYAMYAEFRKTLYNKAIETLEKAITV